MAKKKYLKKKAVPGELISYHLLNTSGVALSINTGLKVKMANGKSRGVSIELLSDKKPLLLRDKDGYSAKQLFESKGVEKYVSKKLVRKVLKKQPLSVA